MHNKKHLMSFLVLCIPLVFLSGCNVGGGGYASLGGSFSDGGSGGVGGTGGFGDGGGVGGGAVGGGVGGTGGGEAVNPEPGSLLLFGSGLLGAAWSRSRAKKRSRKHQS